MIATLTRATTRILEATEADVPTIVAKALDFNASTAYRALIVFEPARLAAVARQLIESDLGVVLLAERDGAVIGMLAAAIQVHPLSGETIATEIVWWMDAAARGGRAALQLLRQYEKWARAQGATVLQMVAPNTRTGGFYTRLGFAEVETLYQRRLA